MSSFLRKQISSCFVTKDNFICRTSLFLSTAKTFVSSAYRINFAPWRFNDRLLIYIKNKRGSRIEPCGTPWVTILDEDWNLCWVCLLLSIWDISINCVLFIRYDWNHLFTEPLIPYESNLSSNWMWLITSYALERSGKVPSAWKWLSRASWTLCINECLAVSVDLNSLNPCFASYYIMPF